MSKISRQNVGGTDFTMVGCTLTGVCASAAADYVKAVTLSDGDELSDGMTVVVAFANGNTAGTAPASTTIYSSDQVNYYVDAGLTQPFTLAPAGCYEIEYTGTGNAYTYISYPVMQVGSVSGPLCDASGNKASGALWLAGDKVSVLYTNGCFNVIPQASSLMTVTAASSVVNGAPVRVGSTVRIMFTADIVGANTSTVLTLKYNGVDIPVRVGKNGALADFNAYEVSSGVYKYLQAYTTLEMMFDGTQFIIIGNPVVLSSADYTIYPDGAITYSGLYTSTEKKLNKKWFGADVYCRVFPAIALSQGLIEVTNEIETSKIINLQGYALASSENVYTLVTLNRGKDELDVFSSNNSIYIQSSGYVGFNAIVVVEYIK